MGYGKERKNTKICVFSHFKRNYDNEVKKIVQKVERRYADRIQRNANNKVNSFSTLLMLNII